MHEAVEQVLGDGLENRRSDDDDDGGNSQGHDEAGGVGKAEGAVRTFQPRVFMHHPWPGQHGQERHDGDNPRCLCHRHTQRQQQHPDGFALFCWGEEGPDFIQGVHAEIIEKMTLTLIQQALAAIKYFCICPNAGMWDRATWHPCTSVP